MHTSIVFLSTALAVPQQPTTAPAGTKEYVNGTGHFRLTLPEGWVQIPQGIVDGYVQMLKGMTGGAAALKIQYDAGFQRADNPNWLMPPHALVTVQRMGKINADDVVKGLTGGRARKELTKGIKEAKGALKGLVQAMSVGEMSYDDSRHRLFINMTAKDATGANVRGLSTTYLTSEGMIQLHCYAPAAQWQKYSPELGQLIDSFRLDKGYEYTPPSGWSALPKWLQWAVIGGLVGGLIGGLSQVVRRLFGRRGAAA